MSDQQLAVGTGAAVSLTVPAAATGAVISVEHASETADLIRFKLDGTAPTSAIGQKLGVGDSMTLSQGQLTRFKAIGLFSSVTIQVTYDYT